MKLHILIAQRKCNYKEQYAPEVLGCMSNSQYNDDSEYLQELKQNSIKSGDLNQLK